MVFVSAACIACLNIWGSTDWRGPLHMYTILMYMHGVHTVMYFSPYFRVLNTDNMSIVGVTIDYGPYGFMDKYDPGHICNGSGLSSL